MDSSFGESQLRRQQDNRESMLFQSSQKAKTIFNGVRNIMLTSTLNALRITTLNSTAKVMSC
jgi:hypothetical protein